MTEPGHPPRPPVSELDDLRLRCARLERLYQVASVIHSTLDPNEALTIILREAVGLVNASSGSVVLVNPTNGFLEIQVGHGLPEHATTLRLRTGEGITGWVARHGRAARVGDVLQDPRYIMVRPNVRSEMALPLEVNGELRGVLNVDSDRLDAFSAEDQALLEEFAGQAAKVIHNTWVYEQSRQRARLLESLFKVAQAVNSALHVDEVLRVITRESTVLMGARMASLLMVDGSREWLDLRASHGAGPAYIQKPRLSLGESLLGGVIRRRKPLQVENVLTDTRYQNPEVARQEGLVSLLSVPLVFSGSCLGALTVYTGEPHSFSNEEIRILGALAEFSAIALEKARLYERLMDVEEQLRNKEKLSALGLLAAEVAHEIRNPLTVMKMLFHSLDLRFPDEDPRSQDVQIMAGKMDHLNRIVEQVLDFARHAEPTPVPTRINQLLEDLSLLVRHKLSNHQITLALALDPDLPEIVGDPGQLEQAFLNLILNAMEAMPGGGSLTLASSLVRPRGGGVSPRLVAITFSDTGVGMSREQRRQAFSSLLQTTKERGTGLGLAIVARVVEYHRGHIRLVSRPGRGTSIRILLPLNLDIPGRE